MVLVQKPLETISRGWRIKHWATDCSLGPAICKMKNYTVCAYRRPGKITWCKFWKDVWLWRLKTGKRARSLETKQAAAVKFLNRVCALDQRCRGVTYDIWDNCLNDWDRDGFVCSLKKWQWGTNVNLLIFFPLSLKQHLKQLLDFFTNGSQSSWPILHYFFKTVHAVSSRRWVYV